MARFAELDELLHVKLTVTKSESDHAIESLGVTAHFPERVESIAGPSPAVKRRDRDAKQLLEISRSGSVSASSAQEIAE